MIKLKKLTIFTLSLGIDGITKSVVSLANALSKKYLVEIIAIYKTSENKSFNIDQNINVKYLIEENIPKVLDLSKCFKMKYFFKYGFKCIGVLKDKYAKTAMAIKECSSDIMISTRVDIDEILSKYGSKKALKIGWDHLHHRRSVKNINDLVLSTIGLNKVVFVSKYLKNWYEREYKVRRIPVEAVYIPNFIDEMPKEKSKLNTNNFVSVGKLTKEKGFLDLVKTFKVMHDLNPDIHLDIIGDGEERAKIEKFINDYKLNKAITMQGIKSEEEVKKIYINSSIYLMTSYTESFGLTLLEAMSYGLPCIAFTSAEGANELITEGCNGYLIKNRSIDEMAVAALNLLNDKETLKKMSDSAILTAKEYTKDVVKEDWIKLIENK